MKSPVLEKIEKAVTSKDKGSSKRRIIAAILVLFIIASICAIAQSLNSSSINISAHFSAVTEGKNPDGSPFDINEIFCDEVLEKAVEKLNGRVSAETIKKHLSVSDKTSAEDIANLKRTIVDGNTDYSFYPNDYILTYSTVSDSIKNDGFFASVGAIVKQIFMPGKGTILKSVAQSYNEYYSDKYIVGNVAMAVDWSEIDSLDYYNQATETKNAAEKISRFILSKYNQNPEFVSEEGIGYGELYTEIDQIINFDVDNYMSFVVQNGVTNNQDSLLRQFGFMANMYDETNTRHVSAYEITEDVIDFYDSNTTKVVFVPALDEARTFYMNRTKVGIDYLVEKAAVEKGAADDALHSAERYRYLTQRFSNVEPLAQEVFNTTGTLYIEVKEKINDFITRAEAIINEGSKSNEHKGIEVGKVYSGADIVSMAISGGKIFVMLFLMGFVAVSFVDYIIKMYRKKRLAGEEECQ